MAVGVFRDAGVLSPGGRSGSRLEAELAGQRGEQSRLVGSFGHTSDGFLWAVGIRDPLMA